MNAKRTLPYIALLSLALAACAPQATATPAAGEVAAAPAATSTAAPASIEPATLPAIIKPRFSGSDGSVEVVKSFWQAYLAGDQNEIAATYAEFSDKNEPTLCRLVKGGITTCVDLTIQKNVIDYYFKGASLSDFAHSATSTQYTILSDHAGDDTHAYWQMVEIRLTSPSPIQATEPITWYITFRVAHFDHDDTWKVFMPDSANAVMPQMATATAPAATATPDMAALFPTATPYAACAGAPLTRLAVGGAGAVTPGSANRLRDAAGKTGKVVANLAAGEAFQVMNGPVCADGLTWYEIRPWNPTTSLPGGTAWTAEGDQAGYWLEPCRIDSECGTMGENLGNP